MKRLSYGMVILLTVGWVATSWAEPESRLQAGEGRDLVLETCTACHSEALVLKNHMTRDRWDETLTWMQEKQGLWALSEVERKTILDYLANYQGTQGIGDERSPGQAMYRYHYPSNPLARQE